MTGHYDIGEALRLMQSDTGIIVTVHVLDGLDAQEAATHVRGNVALLCAQVADPAAICLSVDGEACGADLATALAQEFQVAVVVNAEARGKLHAVRRGVDHILRERRPQYVAVVDQDGDHFGNELLNFVRAARSIEDMTGTDRVLILGRRISRHRPMGFLRGELEELSDRVLLDALAYRAAMTARPLRMEHAFVFDEYPDFHSGYKLFTTPLATDVFRGAPDPAGIPEERYYRHAVEAVMVVEALEHGGYMGVVNRSTLNEQPISTFGLINREQLVADKMIWPCKRLDVPRAFIAQWLDNHIPRLLLRTLVPDGRDELLRIKQLVLAEWETTAADDLGGGLSPPFV